MRCGYPPSRLAAEVAGVAHAASVFLTGFACVLTAVKVADETLQRVPSGYSGVCYRACFQEVERIAKQQDNIDLLQETVDWQVFLPASAIVTSVDIVCSGIVTWRGPYNPLTLYAAGDGVSLNNQIFYAIQAGTGNQPAVSPLFWAAAPLFNATGANLAESNSAMLVVDLKAVNQ